MHLFSMEGEPQPLKGVRVLDLSWFVVGPLATTHLGAAGATVVRVETEVHPCLLRSMSPFHEGKPGLNRSGMYAAYNYNKYSIALNLQRAESRPVVERLVRWADVVVENFMPGVLERLRLTYDDLVRIKPDIVMVGSSGQGRDGPMAQVPVVGNLMQAIVGYHHMTGWPNRFPLGPALAVPDYIAPFYVYTSVIAALDYKQRTGKGVWIDVSQYEAGLQFMAPMLMDYLANGRVQERIGNASPSAAPHGVYRCKGDDRWCAIAVETDAHWEALCRATGHPEWRSDPRFATLAGRLEHREELDRLLEAWTRKRDAWNVMHALQKAGVPAGVAESGEDMDSDPQTEAIAHFALLKHPEMGERRYDRPGFRLEETPVGPTRPAPCLGEHTHEVCTSLLGMSDDDFLRLSEAGVFY